MDSTFYTDTGYAIWCQRGACTRCKYKGCECKCHVVDPNTGQVGIADPEIVAVCRDNAVARGWLGARCQKAQHSRCKKTGCACRCHSGGQVTAPTPIVKEDVPLASDENVLELQERIYAAEASFHAVNDKSIAICEAAVIQIGIDSRKIDDHITGFDTRLANMEAAKTIEIKTAAKPEPIDVGIQHYLFPKLVRYLSYGKIPFLVGPAGSGKTAACQAAAKALDLKFEYLSVNQQTSQTQIMGYNAADGRYIETGFMRSFTEGQVWLGDELDAGLPGIVKVINAPIENGIATFGTKMFTAHENFRPVFAANTFGKGADGVYVGGNQLDGSTLNRFVTIFWEYDWNLAMQICQNNKVVAYVQKLHQIASDLKLRVIIGMRDAKNLADLLRNGEDPAEAEQDIIWASIDVDDTAKLKANIPSDFKDMLVRAGEEGAWS